LLLNYDLLRYFLSSLLALLDGGQDGADPNCEFLIFRQGGKVVMFELL
jgi:hypothetical protein